MIMIIVNSNNSNNSKYSNNGWPKPTYINRCSHEYILLPTTLQLKKMTIKHRLLSINLNPTRLC